jgi:hypothetical protein
MPGPNYYQTGSSEHYDDAFGAAVGISADYAIITAPAWDPDQITDGSDIDNMDWGTGWIFKKDSSGGWSMLTRLLDSNPRYDPYGRNDHLGYAAAIDGDTCVICSGETALSQNWSAEFGACAIYNQDQGGTDNWGITKWVNGHTNRESQHYGYACSISGDYLVVGERAYGTTMDWTGAAFIYARNYGGTNNWGVVKEFVGYPEYAAFGTSVSVDASASPRRVIIGADYSQNGHAGAAYIYEQGGSETTWTTSHLKTGVTGGDQFGHAVGIKGDWAAVGAPYVANGGTRRGTVYVYLRDGGGSWNLFDTLTPADTADYDYFGSTISMEEGILLIGARGDDPAGSVYVYKLSGNSWTNRGKLTGSDSESGDSFGYFYNSVTTVDVSGDNVIVGAYGYDTAHNDEGAAYIFDLGKGLAPGSLLLLQLD